MKKLVLFVIVVFMLSSLYIATAKDNAASWSKTDSRGKQEKTVFQTASDSMQGTPDTKLGDEMQKNIIDWFQSAANNIKTWDATSQAAKQQSLRKK